MRAGAFLAMALAAMANGPAAFAAELGMRFTPRWRQDAVVLPAEVENRAGQRLQVTRFAALVSEIALLREDGSVVRFDGQFGFIDAAEARTAFALRNVPAGSYVGVEFQFGLAPEFNRADPGRWPAGHALNPLVNRLHWSWQGGYVFVALEGRWQNRGENGEATRWNGGFLYHLATEPMRVPVRIRMPFDVGGATRLEFAIDLARLLDGRRIGAAAGDESTHSAEGDDLAGELAAALQRAVFGLGATEHGEKEEGKGAAGLEGDSRRVGDNAPYLTPWAFVVPAGFPQPELPADNLPTVEGVALGETLFRDPRLSGNGAQSCASCHAPERGFSDRVALSRGADGGLGKRNAMPLFNLAWNPNFAWDGSQPKVRDQARAAWTNPVEMHADPGRVVAALAQDEGLTTMFTAAFGSPKITSERVTLALEQFLLTIVAADSRFDRATRGAGTLSEEEQRGFELFATEFDPARGKRGADCFHCHGGVLFSDFAFKNTGLETEPVDAGRERVTRRKLDAGRFKTPSLRNVAVTGPYMHDGRFATLEEVIAHYDHGVKRNAGLDPNLAKHPAEGLELTAEDQRALVAFLRTLTDARWADQGAQPKR